MPAKRANKEDWRSVLHQMPSHPHAPGDLVVLLKWGARTSKAKKLQGKSVTDPRFDDILSMLERGRKQRSSVGLKGLFGGGE